MIIIKSKEHEFISINNIDTFIDTIREDSKLKYSEIENEYNISPYGGLDISYLPKSASHHFMDRIYTMCNEAGISNILTKNELTEKIYTSLIQNDDMSYFKSKLDNYQKAFDSFIQKDEVLNLITKYEPFMPLLANGGHLRNQAFELQQSYNSVITDLEKSKSILANLQKKSFNFVEKLITKKDEYSNNLNEIENVSLEIKKLEETEIPKFEIHKELLDLNVKFQNLDSIEISKCIQCFELNDIPTTREFAEIHFQKCESVIKNNKEDIDLINKVLDKMKIASKETVVALYNKEFPAIKQISEQTAIEILKLNKTHMKTFSIADLKTTHKQIGEKLDLGGHSQSFESSLRKDFNHLSNIIDDLKKAQLTEKASTVVSKNLPKFDGLDIG